MLAAAVLAGVVYGGYLGWTVTIRFDERAWDVPARIYAAPLELYAGRRLSEDDLAIELVRLGYRELIGPLETGTFLRNGARIELWTRAFEHAGVAEAPRVIQIAFDGDRIAEVRDVAGAEIPLLQLDPLLIGSVFPAHGEDRIIIGPDEVPPLLTEVGTINSS